MVYVNLTINDDDNFTCTVKIIAENIKAFNDYKAHLVNECSYTIIEEFVDIDAGSIVILPEDFKY